MTPLVLGQHDGIIFFNVFDEVEIQSQPDDRAHDVLSRKERRFLGSFELPFGTVYGSSKPIKGEFRIELPQILYGYEHVGGEPMFIRLSISLEPQLLSPEVKPAKTVPGFEPGPLLKHIARWQDKNSKRKPTAVGTDINGDSVLVSRFMCPLAPPQDVTTLGDPYAIEKAAQFVAMLPFLRDSDMFDNVNASDLWLNSQEFLDVGASDWEEHAILLANYFAAIDTYRMQSTHFKAIETYCLIGEAIPEGDSVFVLRKCAPEEGAKKKKDTAFEIWQPGTGVSWHSPYKKLMEKPIDQTKSPEENESGKKEKPTLFESHGCPLKKVFCAFNSQNVWACLQDLKQDDSALKLSYDFDNPKHWAPLFSKADYDTYFAATEGKVMPLIDKIDYKPFDPLSAQTLQEELQLFVENRFIDRRSKGSHGRKQMRANVLRGEMYNHLMDALQRLELMRTSQRKGDTPDFPLHCVSAPSTAGLQSVGTVSAGPASTALGMTEAELFMTHQKVFEQSRGRRMYGVPIHMQYSDNEELWERIENTSILSLGEEECEFFFAVRVFKYSSQVTSLWVFAMAVGLST
jgi:coiled-coil and C2 domain-containing protein 2A